MKTNQKTFLLSGLVAIVLCTAFVFAAEPDAQTVAPVQLNLPIAPGPFQPTMESLSNYTCPDWFRDAKFGIWAHWGP
jgi:hypothetical protein